LVPNGLWDAFAIVIAIAIATDISCSCFEHRSLLFAVYNDGGTTQHEAYLPGRPGFS
jgi:hypothetical protein